MKIVCFVGLLLLGIFFKLIQERRSQSSFVKTYQKSERAIGNPLMGFSPSAANETVSDDINLVYIDVTWANLEPKQGDYDWEAIETKYQFKQWRSQGKHAVLRFVCDYPQTDDHLDIPKWLYNKTKDGQHYDNSLGKGYSPNYNNPTFLKEYQKAVREMGEHWGDDTFIAYIELGVLGHWGEWHTALDKGSKGAIPEEDSRDRYVMPWQVAFPKAKILMRRPFRIAAEEGFGLFNDVMGDNEQTQIWLDWIQNGGSYDQTDEADALSAMPKFWKKSPSGGELTSSVTMNELMVSELEATKQQLQQSHTTFLGPKIADQTVSKEAYDELLKNMGYRFHIKQAKLSANGKLAVQIENLGVAPIYWKWPVVVYLNKGDSQVTSRFDIRKVLPGKTATITFKLNLLQRSSWRQLDLAIIDPMTTKPAVHFANEKKESDTRLTLMKR